MSCIFAFYLLAGVRPAGQTPDPDELYKQREKLSMAEQAADIWAARATAGTDFEALWKLARASYWIGTHAGTEPVRRAALERGVDAGVRASVLEEAKPEGHFWMAANMGALAESFGLSQGIRYRGRIKSALERVLAIDPGWQQGSADRALGWWFHMVPGLFGGSENDAERHLRKALTYNPQSTATLYFLGEVLLERGKKDDAEATFKAVLDAPTDPDWAPEDRGFKRRADEALKKLRS